jgi:hypothetical protein
MTVERLSEFVVAVRRQTLDLFDDDRFPDDQRDLLHKAVGRMFAAAEPGDWAQPLGLLYAVYRGYGRRTDRQAHLIGAFCVCYLASFDLFDDVQDDDLAGKPLEGAGAPIAINTALALFRSPCAPCTRRRSWRPTRTRAPATWMSSAGHPWWPLAPSTRI